MDDLDSLFPAKNKGSSNSAGSSLKIRSSTISKTRQHNGLTGHVGALTTSDKRQFFRKKGEFAPDQNSSSILLKNAVREADIQSL